MSAHRTGTRTGIYIGALTILVPTFVAGLLAGGTRGAWVAWASAVGVITVSGWYLWPWLRRVRFRWPIYTPANPRDVAPLQRPPLPESERRRQLKMLLIQLARRGDELIGAPPSITMQWVGEVTDVLEDSLGQKVVNLVSGQALFIDKIRVLRHVIRTLDRRKLRAGFDPRDLP